MKSIGVIGGGVSGLAVARLLKQRGMKTQILEKNDYYGGIARTRDVDGSAYHLIGGHCFNSKFPEVLDFVFEEVMSADRWNKIERKADIYFRKQFVKYPIEFSMKEIFQIDPSMAERFVVDFFKSNDYAESRNLKEWFVNSFGKSLAEEYFIPYNEKIWGMPLEEMSPEWVRTKLPMPDKNQFLKGLFSEASDSMPHSTFYYPKSNNQNEFIECLSKGLDIIVNYEVLKIRACGDGWMVNDDKYYDHIINTMPLNEILSRLDGVPESVSEAARALRYNRITTMLWKRKPLKSTWTYFPEPSTPFHRHIHIGNFFKPSQDLTITEALGELSYKEMVEAGREIDYLLEPLDYNVSKHAYVVFDKKYAESRERIINFLENIGVYTLGRFGEWEYYNMDVCIKSAIDLSMRVR